MLCCGHGINCVHAWQKKYDLPTDLTIGAHVVAIQEAKLAEVSTRRANLH